MNKVDNSLGAYDEFEEENNVALVDVLIVLVKYKKLIIGSMLVAVLGAAAVSMLIPDTFRANTRLLPPQQAQSSAAALLSQLGGVAGAMAGGAGVKNPNDIYISMLKSRTIADKVIAQFELGKVYDLQSPDETRQELAKNTTITAGKDGLITIELDDHDRNRAARIVNGYVDELQKLTRVLAVTEASKRRVFFERQLEQAKDNLAAAEMKLKSALSSRGVISVDVESRAVVETVGRLRAQISAKEIQLSSMAAFVTTTNPEYRRTQEELSSLRGELSKLENGRPGVPTQPDGTKQAGLENIKVLRDVKYYQMLYELLAKQYEVARLDEAKDVSIIQVLDPAVIPERKVKPKRAVIVGLAGFLGLLAGIGLAFLLDTRKRVKLTPERSAKWGEFSTLLGFKK